MRLELFADHLGRIALVGACNRQPTALAVVHLSVKSNQSQRVSIIQPQHRHQTSFSKKKIPPPQCARPPLDGTPSLESPADSIQINRINPSDSSTSYSTIIIRIAMTRPAAARWHCRSGMRQLDPISNSVMILCFRRANESYARRQVLQEPR